MGEWTFYSPIPLCCPTGVNGFSNWPPICGAGKSSSCIYCTVNNDGKKENDADGFFFKDALLFDILTYQTNF